MNDILILLLYNLYRSSFLNYDSFRITDIIGGEGSPGVSGMEVSETPAPSCSTPAPTEIVAEETQTSETTDRPTDHQPIRHAGRQAAFRLKRRLKKDIEKERAELEVRFLKLRNRNLILKNQKLELELKLMKDASP